MKGPRINFVVALLLVFYAAFWDQAGGDFERYISVYHNIFEIERNFEWLFHSALLIGQYLRLDYFIVQGFFITIFAIPYLYLVRRELNFHMLTGFLYFFVVWGVGSPRQFAAAICIFIYFKNRNKFANAIPALLTAFLIYTIHIPAAFFFLILISSIFLSEILYFLFATIIFFVLLTFQYDLFTYVYQNYISGDLHSQGVFLRLLPFVFLIVILNYSSVRNYVFNNYMVYLAGFFTLLGLSLGFTTAVDRVYLLLFPTLLYYFSVPLNFKYLGNRIVNISLGLYWCCFLLSWYFIAESAANWRLSRPFLHNFYLF